MSVIYDSNQDEWMEIKHPSDVVATAPEVKICANEDAKSANQVYLNCHCHDFERRVRKSNNENIDKSHDVHHLIRELNPEVIVISLETDGLDPDLNNIVHVAMSTENEGATTMTTTYFRPTKLVADPYKGNYIDYSSLAAKPIATEWFAKFAAGHKDRPVLFLGHAGTMFTFKFLDKVLPPDWTNVYYGDIEPPMTRQVRRGKAMFNSRDPTEKLRMAVSRFQEKMKPCHGPDGFHLHMFTIKRKGFAGQRILEQLDVSLDELEDCASAMRYLSVYKK